MNNITTVNDLVIRFANVNGTGSASANDLFAKALFRMGLPVSPKNIFPSNIQGLPTWYEVRVSDKGYLGRRQGVDMMVSVNPQSMEKDIADVRVGGYFVYDNTKPLAQSWFRDDVTFIGLPLTRMCLENYSDPRQQQLFKNIIYVGALAALLDMDFDVITNIINEKFASKEKLIPPNILALELGRDFAKANYTCPSTLRVESRDLIGDKILINGNSAAALGAVYGGASVAAWYPITPSTSCVDAFGDYCKKYRTDQESGKKNYAIVQAEDELAAIGMVVGAMWNGARAFTATSGPGISLMSEFLGLAYYAEVPVVLFNIQRTGPSTGMPTRTQQSDVMACAYASHGDTKHVLLFPSTPKECFDMGAISFDLAEHLQTPVIMLSDLDLGMNDWISEPFEWDDSKAYNRGKVLNAEQLDDLTERWGRYNDTDGDGIPWRTIPGTHPSKGSYFTRGASRDEYAVYTEDSAAYKRNVDRLALKWETAKTQVPEAEFTASKTPSKIGMIYFGTSEQAVHEAADRLEAQDVHINLCRIRAFPFTAEIEKFIQENDLVFVVEQNRDAQMRTLLINETEVSPAHFAPVLNYDGMPITAGNICDQVNDYYANQNTAAAG